LREELNIREVCLMKVTALSFPPEYRRMWDQLHEVACAVLSSSTPLPDKELWPLLALTKKAANSVIGAAALVSLELWGDALVIGRSLLELDIILKWLIEKDTKIRLTEYLSGISEEKKRFAKKIDEGYSTFAQVYGTLYPDELRAMAHEGGKTWSKHHLRELSVETNKEPEYDSFYWISSAYVHSHALSLLEWNSELRRQENVLSPLFCMDRPGPFEYAVIIGIPSLSLGIFGTTNEYLSLGIGAAIDLARKALEEDVLKISGGMVHISRDLKDGVIVKAAQLSGQTTEISFTGKQRPPGRR
jgi:hypothetical protein